VHVNPIATNSVGSPMGSAKNFNSFGAGIQQETLQGAPSIHGSSAAIRANSVRPPDPEVDPICSLNPEVDATDTPEPVPGVDSPATPARAWDTLPVKHASSAHHVPSAVWDSGSSVLGSSTLPTRDPTSGMSSAVAHLGSTALLHKIDLKHAFSMKSGSQKFIQMR
jgi:hypothetical protein